MAFNTIFPNLLAASFGHSRNKITVIRNHYTRTADPLRAVAGTKILLLGPIEDDLRQMHQQLTRRQFQELVPISANAHQILSKWLAGNEETIQPIETKANGRHTIYRLETSPPIIILRNRAWETDSWQLAENTNVLLVGKIESMRKYLLHSSGEFQEAARIGDSTRTSLRRFLNLEYGKGRPSNEFLQSQ